MKVKTNWEYFLSKHEQNPNHLKNIIYPITYGKINVTLFYTQRGILFSFMKHIKHTQTKETDSPKYWTRNRQHWA